MKTGVSLFKISFHFFILIYSFSLMLLVIYHYMELLNSCPISSYNVYVKFF